MKTLVITTLLFLVGCTTHPHQEGRERYHQKIEAHSAGDKQFAGLYHNFEFRSTRLNREITETIHQRLQQFYDWDEQESQQKLDESLKAMNSKTKFWLSFFTPDGKNDNLANKVSIWKIYLKAGGQRYEGRAIKANKNYDEAKALFPYHSRWATAYYLEFPVAANEIEGQPVKLIITGPLGRRQAQF